MKIGKASVDTGEQVFIRSSACIGGTKEGQGPLGADLDMTLEDDLFGCKSWEEAESNLQKDAIFMALGKAGMKAEEIRYLFAGDLLAQEMATAFGVGDYQIPLIGLYGACSTAALSLSMVAMAVSGGWADQVVCVTSSHFASAEK